MLFSFYRNAKKELNDIRFEFAVGKDSAEGIASELIGAGLVDTKDMGVITSNLQKLVDSRDTLKVVTFPLVSILLHFFIFIYVSIITCLQIYFYKFQNSCQTSEVLDDKALIGYAQISITD